MFHDMCHFTASRPVVLALYGYAVLPICFVYIFSGETSWDQLDTNPSVCPGYYTSPDSNRSPAHLQMFISPDTIRQSWLISFVPQGILVMFTSPGIIRQSWNNSNCIGQPVLLGWTDIADTTSRRLWLTEPLHCDFNIISEQVIYIIRLD